jgi:predicted RNA-binding protein with PUA-like domain
MATFLLKTEPSTYSYADLVREKRTVWSGVSNPAALKALRSMRKGDAAFIYHTGDEKAVVGLARVVSGAYEDPERPGTNTEGLPKFAVVDLEPVRAAKTALSLAEMKGDARFKDFELLRLSRLSVMPVPGPIDKLIRKLTGIGA